MVLAMQKQYFLLILKSNLENNSDDQPGALL